MTQTELLTFTVAGLEKLGIRYMLVGSLASGLYGEARMTLDIDLVVSLELTDAQRLAGMFPEPDFYFSPSATVQAIHSGGQFNIIHIDSGLKIDCMIARADAWGKEQFARRRRMNILPGADTYVARPEDIILSKLLYYQEGGSDKHLRDIGGILKISKGSLDSEYLEKWSRQLGVEPLWLMAVRRTEQSPADGSLF